MNINRYVANNAFGTNAYLVWDEESRKAFIVDPGSALPAAEQTIEKEGLELEYIIITHAHGDHTGGINAFREKYPDVKLVASRAERKLLYDRHASFGKGGYTADIEVRDGDVMNVGAIELKFIDCPGHTAGGMSIYADKKVLFSGDTLFHASVGRTDLPGGDWDVLTETIKTKLYVLPDDTVVLPGHMDETTIGWEKRYNPFVQI
ncbi:MAG: MBL fold metallo-hydrolase [Firmicutes bacterium]|nr:MBL fold metallo-hydrolase [Bacillota bacterium]